MNKLLTTKKTILIYLLTQIIGFALLMFVDFISERINENQYLSICFIGVPIVIFILYLIQQFIYKQYKEELYKKMLNKIIWFVSGLVLSFLVIYATLELEILVPQARNGWENFLNGIEYYIFAFMILIPNTFSFIIVDLIVWFYNFFKNKKAK